MRKIKLVLFLTLIFYFLPFFLFHHLASPSLWEGYPTYRPLPKLQEFYEKNQLQSPVRQVWNTYSSGAYFLSGLWILFHFSYLEARVYGFSLLILAYGSGCFHASLTTLGHRLDLVGMYLPFFTLLFFPLRSQKRILWPLFLILTLSLTFAFFVSVWIGYPLLFSLLLLKWGKKKKEPAWKSAILLFIFAFLLQRLDVAKIAPLHWLWHILTAICLCLLFQATLAPDGPTASL